MGKDHDSNVWVGTDHGLVRINTSGVASFDRPAETRVPRLTAVYEIMTVHFGTVVREALKGLRTGRSKLTRLAKVFSRENVRSNVDSESRTWFLLLFRWTPTG